MQIPRDILFSRVPFVCTRLFFSVDVKKDTKWLPIFGRMVGGSVRTAIETENDVFKNHETIAVPLQPLLLLDIHEACSARYVNDGTGNGIPPNVLIEMDDTVECAADYSWNTIFLRLLRDVKAGEEVSAKYGETYWSEGRLEEQRKKEANSEAENH